MDLDATPMAPGGEGLTGHNSDFRNDRMGVLRRISQARFDLARFLGNHFATMEAQLALPVLLRRYRFELVGDDEPEPTATLRPKRGIRARVRCRIHARASLSEARITRARAPAERGTRVRRSAR